jgi:hypothetical protein
MTTKDSTPVTYADAAHKHAASSAFGTNYTYDANGNQTKRDTSGTIYNLAYDYENRAQWAPAGISGAATASFVHDADAGAHWARIKSTVGVTTTVYIAGVYEFIDLATDRVTKYYEGNAMRRSGYGGTNDGVFYLLQDHLKSSSIFVNQSGATVTTNYYLPYGGRRSGTFSDLSTKRFTGQYHEAGLTSDEGLSYYGARWYDAKFGI